MFSYSFVICTILFILLFICYWLAAGDEEIPPPFANQSSYIHTYQENDEDNQSNPEVSEELDKVDVLSTEQETKL